MSVAEQVGERYSRQKDIVPADRIAACKATIVGVSAIGRQVALQLTAMRILWLQLVAPDTVDVSNLASQGYLEADLGKFKVDTTAELCSKINTDLELDLTRIFHRIWEFFNRQIA